MFGGATGALGSGHGRPAALDLRDGVRLLPARELREELVAQQRSGAWAPRIRRARTAWSRTGTDRSARPRGSAARARYFSQQSTSSERNRGSSARWRAPRAECSSRGSRGCRLPPTRSGVGVVGGRDPRDGRRLAVARRCGEELWAR